MKILILFLLSIIGILTSLKSPAVLLQDSSFRVEMLWSETSGVKVFRQNRSNHQVEVLGADMVWERISLEEFRQERLGRTILYQQFLDVFYGVSDIEGKVSVIALQRISHPSARHPFRYYFTPDFRVITVPINEESQLLDFDDLFLHLDNKRFSLKIPWSFHAIRAFMIEAQRSYQQGHTVSVEQMRKVLTIYARSNQSEVWGDALIRLSRELRDLEFLSDFRRSYMLASGRILPQLRREEVQTCQTLLTAAPDSSVSNIRQLR